MLVKLKRTNGHPDVERGQVWNLISKSQSIANIRLTLQKDGKEIHWYCNETDYIIYDFKLYLNEAEKL